MKNKRGETFSTISTKMAKLTQKKVKNSIDNSMGIRSLIAQRCGVDRSTLTKFLEKDKNQKIADLIEEEKEKTLDIGEKQLLNLVTKGDFQAVKLLLTTRGRKRGYVEKQEISHENAPISINIQEDKNNGKKQNNTR